MIGFRVDANEQIATGHLMRCITIASECQKRGIECIFFLAEEKETERLKDRKIDYQILETDWKNMEEELPALKEKLAQVHLEWLIVDSYQVTLNYLLQMEKQVPVLYIDDLNAEKYPISAVLHYIGWQSDQKAADEYCLKYQDLTTKVLFGMQYAPLREEFSEVMFERMREKSILITTGGTDMYNVAGRVVSYCKDRTEFRDYIFHVIVGSMNSYEAELKQMAEDNPRILLHRNVSNIGEYMRSCEIALSAGGTTLLELCACRIPTVCFTFADNQQELAGAMGKHKVVCYVGDVRENQQIEETICKKLLFFMENEVNRNHYAKCMGEVVDGRGTERIVDFLLSK